MEHINVLYAKFYTQSITYMSNVKKIKILKIKQCYSHSPSSSGNIFQDP